MATNLRGRGEGSKNVAAAGTPEKLSATRKLMSRAIVSARPANTAPVAIGFSNAVRATPGAEIGALIKAGESLVVEASDLSQLWIDAKVNGEGVSFTYFIALERFGG